MDVLGTLLEQKTNTNLFGTHHISKNKINLPFSLEYQFFPSNSVICISLYDSFALRELA